MNRKAFKTCAGLTATALGLLGAQAAAQTPPTAFPGDWPNLGAYNNRQGQNGNPALYNSGTTDLRWVSPSTPATRNPIEIDNTSLRDTSGFVGGPYDPPGTNLETGQPGFAGDSYVGVPFPNAAAWPGPTDPNKEASLSQTYPRRRIAIAATPATDVRDRLPRYNYATCVPSSRNRQRPTETLDGTPAKYFEWNLRPVAGPERTYAVYAFIPEGPTSIPVGGTPTSRFPQDRYVYEVRFGQDLDTDANPVAGTPIQKGVPDGVPDGRYIDIVDTRESGFGWVRLGGNGRSSEAAFPTSGIVNPLAPAIGPNGSFIRVRLYNTVPREDDNSLSITGSFPDMSDQAEKNLAATRLVYADAMRARPQPGTFVASPTASTVVAGTTLRDPVLGAPTIDWRVVAASNNYVAGLLDGQYQQTVAGTVVAYQGNPSRWPNPLTPLVSWRYSVTEESANNNTTDNPAALFSGGWATSTVNPRHIGADYRTINAVTTGLSTASATFQPTLDDGSYDVFLYIGGDTPTEKYAHGTPYIVQEGNVVVASGSLDQSVASGWVRLGNRRYLNDPTNGSALKVIIGNRSTTTEAANAKIFVDAVRFVTATDIGIESTPVHATVNIKKSSGVTEPTKVVIVADERGRIHCLDLAGNPDGSTTEYWSYPSTPNYLDENWKDPNLSEIVSGTSGIDGAINPSIKPARNNEPTATMPRSFDLSTAAVANVGGVDLLYIGATNGRVYCIEMAGRGDYSADTHVVGSTKRQWTYPNDYDPTNPAAPIAASALGRFRGSVVFGDSAQGVAQPTLFVPARQGRIIALNAGLGNVRRQTTFRWQFPSATDPTIPTISMTPTLFKNALYFGTLRDLNDDGPGRFYALNAGSGAVKWRVNGPAGTAPGDDGSTVKRFVPTAGSYVANPIAVAGSVLSASPPAAGGTPVAHEDTIYEINDDLSLSAHRASDGSYLYRTRPEDLQTLCDTGLTYTVVSTFDRVGLTAQNLPVIIVPGTNGEITAAFARPEDYSDQFNDPVSGVLKTNYFAADLQRLRGGNARSVAAANNFLFTADDEGALYAYDQEGFSGGNLLPYPQFDSGSRKGLAANDPAARPFRHLRIRLINKTTYLLLRETDELGMTSLTYQQAVVGADAGGPVSSEADPYAFEWGESAYVLVYGFPYTTVNQDDNPVPVSQVTVTLTSEGRVVPPQQAFAHRFKPGGATSPPTDPPPVDEDPNGKGYVQDGYAVVRFTFQNAGASALPPGNGTITASIQTAAAGYGPASTPIPIRPDYRDANSVVYFRTANPLRLVVESVPGGTQFGYGSYGSYDGVDAQNVSNAVNGSPDIDDPAAPPSTFENQLLASAGFGNHGGTTTARFYLSDRSLMALQNPDGLTNVRLNRTNLQRQGGAAGLWNPLNTALYPAFEDQPVNFPNTSLDYPDIGREQVRAVKDPTGNPENPLLSAVSLRPPVSAKSGTIGQPLTEEDLFESGGVRNVRTIQPTRFDLPIDIPRYQPPVNTDPNGPLKPTNPSTVADNPSDLLHLRRNSVGDATLPQGYFGRVQAYIDSNSDAKLTQEGARETYRAFNYSVGVLPQTSIQVGTPSVDLGSLAAGTGYAPNNPSAAEATAYNPFSPWNATAGSWAGAYQPISVRNDGNVNLRDLRLAKAQNVTGNAGDNQPWPITTADNDPLAWMSAVLIGAGNSIQPGDLWGNFDTTFAPTNRHTGGGNLVILPKPRVTDRVPSELVVNPYPRANPNIYVDPNGNVTTPALGVPVDGTDKYRINLAAGYGSTVPKVAASVPIGFPVGNYSTQIRVVENAYTADSSVLNFLKATQAYEAYSDPISLTFKVRETRMTNRTTPRTAPVFDDPSTFPAILESAPLGNDPFRNRAAFRNSAPAAMRDYAGSLITAFESDRASRAVLNGIPLAVNPTLLYFGSLDNAADVTRPGAGAEPGNAPLWDLNQFLSKDAKQWFKPYNGGNGYPANGASLFSGGAVVTSTMRFASPSFPSSGSVNPLTGGATTKTYMGFLGEAQVRTDTGLLSQSKVFVAPVTSEADGALSVGAPIAAGGDAQTAKGKPSVVQFGESGALVFYSETSAGQSGITASRLVIPQGGAAAFAAPVPLNFGDGFSSVFSPSATARPYRNGAGVGNTGINPQVVELSFAGKLRGRANAEVYLSRLRLDTPNGGGGLQLVDAAKTGLESGRANSPFVLLPRQTFERMVNDGNGVFRARGVLWSRGAGVQLQQFVGTAAGMDLLIGTPTVERQSGLIVYDSRLGGKVYLDPELGTVRFAGSVPGRNAEIRISYTPTFLRVTPGGSAAYSAVNGLFDHRNVGVRDYWFEGNGAYVSQFGGVNANTLLHNDRYFYAYGRGAAGGGVTARPYTTTMRLGLRLPTRIATDSQGRVVGIKVAGNTRPYQVDPANGRVYFQAEDEDRDVTVTYQGVNEATNAPIEMVVTGSVSFVLEKGELPIAVDEAANDSAVTAFLDPLDYPTNPRPPLVWLFYVSTRAGGPDVYFQTIAPRYLPFSK